jgi:hypothetical protein
MTVSGTLNLAGCVTSSLNLAAAETQGDVILEKLAINGVVSAVGASIGGQLILDDANLNNEGGNALVLNTAVIKEDALLRNLTATGEILALNANIGSQFNLRQANLNNKCAMALRLDGAEIKGGVILEKLAVNGVVSAVGASIGGQLILDDANISNEGGNALVLDGADVHGGAFLTNLTATGEVRGVSANLSRHLTLDDATLNNEGGDALNLAAAMVGVVFLRPASLKGTVRLTAVQIDELIVPEKMGVLTANQLDASGWRLRDVGGAMRRDRRAADGWLTSNSSGKDSEFVAQPWHELANVYDRNGQPADARWLRWKAARGVTRTSPWWSKPIRWSYGALVGHGYYPLVAALWLILAVLVTIGIVSTHRDNFAPTATNRAAWKPDVPADKSDQPITGATPCDQLKDPSTCLNPVLWSFDNVLPGTLATGQAGLWTPNGAQNWNLWVPYALGALKLFSWILVALLLAGVTGLLRKT